MHLATNAQGELRVCCNSTPGPNVIRKDDGSPYTLYNDDLQEAWNSKDYQKIRFEFLNSKRPNMCKRCFSEEDAGVKSARQFANQKWGETGMFLPHTEFNIRYVDLRLGNLCNLKCRMCNPWASNQWVKEWADVYPQEIEDIEGLANVTWPEVERTWKNLYEIVETVEQIYLTGGEPTIIKEQIRLLQYCIDNNFAKNIKLKYNTNLTNIPQKLTDLWKQFKTVQLNCSIDAHGELDRYIRYPSSWQKVEENFNTIRQFENVEIEIHCTVQMYNILYLDKFLDWCKDYQDKIYFNILDHPDALNIKNLPKSLKYLATERLQNYMHIDRIPEVIKYMNSDDCYDTHFKYFVMMTNTLDKNRGENLFQHVPEFQEYF